MKSNHAYGSFSANFVTAIYDYECRCRLPKLNVSHSLAKLNAVVALQTAADENWAITRIFEIMIGFIMMRFHV
jgi:phage baseplate assembly protein W